MSLTSNAQAIEQIVVDDLDSHDHVVVYPTAPSPQMVMEMHEPESHAAESPVMLETSEPGQVEIYIDLDDLPGVMALDPELEQKLEVSDDDTKEEDNNDAKKSTKPVTKWDWESKGADGFLTWIKERISDIPKHSGYDTAGIERAISYLDKLDTEISKAMRLDLDGDLDADKVEEVRSKIYDGIERLNERHDIVNKKKKKKKKSTAADNSQGLVKEGQKIPGVTGIVVTVPLMIAGVVRTCINGNISAGHDIEDMFEKLSKKLELDDKQKFECLQLFADMGYPVRRDRGFLLDEDIDTTSSDNFDWAANYQA